MKYVSMSFIIKEINNLKAYFEKIIIMIMREKKPLSWSFIDGQYLIIRQF